MKKSNVKWIVKIPENWNVIRIKRKYINQKIIVGKEEKNYERLALTLNGVIKRSKSDGKGLQPEKFESYQILHKNDLVFKLIDLENVKTSRVGYSPYTGLVSPVYIRLINPKESRFGYYFFMNMWHQEVFNYLGSGVRSNLTANDLLNVPYLDIPSNEKEKIVNILDEATFNIDKIIKETKESIEELSKYKQSIITEAVTKGLDSSVEVKDSQYEVIGHINTNYNIIPLRYLGELQNGISKSGNYFGEGYPFVSYSDVYKNRVLPDYVNGLVRSSENEQDLYSVKKDDIFFTRTSEVIEEVGMASVCLSDIEQATFAGFLIRFRPYINNNFTSEYAKYYIEASFIRDFFAKEMNLVTRASLSQPLLKRLPIILPSIEEQQDIVTYLNDQTNRIDSLIKNKEKVILELEQYKKSLIYECVTGKKEV